MLLAFGSCNYSSSERIRQSASIFSDVTLSSSLTWSIQNMAMICSSRVSCTPAARVRNPGATWPLLLFTSPAPAPVGRQLLPASRGRRSPRVDLRNSLQSGRLCVQEGHFMHAAQRGRRRPSPAVWIQSEPHD